MADLSIGDTIDKIVGESFTALTLLAIPIGGTMALTNTLYYNGRYGMNGLNPFTNNSANGTFGQLLTNVNKALGQGINAIAQLMLQPNLGGIPIQAEEEQVSRSVDISNTLILSQGDNHKKWISDNAAPQLREWTVSGYLSTIMPLVDWGLIVKPSLAMQLMLLDFYATCRRPVYFKSFWWNYQQVLVKDYKAVTEPSKLNGIKVDITLQEYKVQIQGDGNTLGIPSALAAVGGAVAELGSAIVDLTSSIFGTLASIGADQNPAADLSGDVQIEPFESYTKIKQKTGEF